MALLGQASGGFTESSSALRILHVGVRNTVGILTDDAFTQTNPPISALATSSLISQSAGMDTAVLGVLSGSVAFTRPDEGSNYIGGNAEGLATAANELFVRPLGLFINTAVGNAYENTPGVASGKGPYVSAQGTYGNSLYETQAQANTSGGTTLTAGDDLQYYTGAFLIASRNGYLMPQLTGANGNTSTDGTSAAAEREHGHAASTVIGVLKMPADSTQPEIVFDQRI